MQLNVIPYPALVEYIGPDLYCFPGSACIRVTQPVLFTKAKYLHDALQQRFDVTVSVDNVGDDHCAAADSSAAITLHLSEQLEQLHQFRWSQEAYELTCDASGVQIAATSVNGVFYGIQTLLQALQVSANGLVLPHTRVLDAPRFIWRGVLLDVGRHFFSVPFVKKLLDVMAIYKMNRFHWHLTEDQGWRLDVPALPRLAEVAAWRGTPPVTPSSSCGDQQALSQQPSDMSDSEAPAAAAAADSSRFMLGRSPPSAAVYHGGCYSMSDVAAVVEYAAERGIEVVPEIELPGHCCAALAAYPHLSCTNDVTAVSTQWGIHEDVYCAGNEEVFQFLEVVFDQVVSQFPCEYIHIGGDEVPKARWKECHKCQQRIKQEGLSDECELQSWFVRRVSKMLAERGRRLIGWDEILEGGLAEGATVMSWRGTLGGVLAAKSGHDVIMTPTSHCYFDYKQALSADEPGAWYACLPLHVVYHFDPVPQQLQHKDTAATLTAAQDRQGEQGHNRQLEDSSACGAQTEAERSRLSGVEATAADVALGPQTAVEDVEMTAASDSDGSCEDEDAHHRSKGNADDHITVSHQPSDARLSMQQHRTLAQQQDQPTAAAAVIASSPAAATAAGPHFPGEPPGVALTRLAAVTATESLAAAEAAEGTTEDDQSTGHSGNIKQPSADVDTGTAGDSSKSSGVGLVLSASESLRVLGSQANLWCEYVQDEETAEYMLLPRLAAMAEALWTPTDLKDWGDFLGRLDDHLPLLDQLGYIHRSLNPKGET